MVERRHTGQSANDRMIQVAAADAAEHYLHMFPGSDSESYLWARHPELSETDARRAAQVADMLLSNIGSQLGPAANRALKRLKEKDNA